MQAVVFAAGLDWLEGLLPALFVGFWILSQVFALFRRIPRGRDPVVVVKPMPLEPPPVPNRDRLEREIEDFLAERRSGQSPANDRRELSSDQPPKRRSQRRGDPRRPRGSGKPPRGADPAATPPPLPAQMAIEQPRPPAIDSTVSRHVDRAFANDLAHESPRSVDDNAVAASTPTKAPSALLAALLRDPETIRKIVVLREVLERPTDRWQ